MNYKKIQKIEADYKAQKASSFILKPFAFSISNGTTLKGLACRPSEKYSSYYYGKVVKKEKIVLHFTAGHLQGDLNQLTQKNYHVSVAFVIARDGTIYQLHHSKHWAYHLGPNAIGGNEPQSQKAIGIEISNYGPLIPKEGRMETIYSRPKSKPTIIDVYCNEAEEDKFVKLPSAYRQKTFFATYTDEQYEQLIVLIKYLSTQHDIPIAFLPASERFQTTDTVIDFKGIVSHVNFRKDKTDIGPAFDWDRLETGLNTNAPVNKKLLSKKLAAAQKAFDQIELQVQTLQVKIWDNPSEIEADVAALLQAEADLERAYDKIQTLKRNAGNTSSDVSLPLEELPTDIYTSEDAIEIDFPCLMSRGGLESTDGEDGPEERAYNPMAYEV